MNLQQAKALAIEEGNVKTIHDKNNQLLWGAVGFDTTYRGDTTQQTYSGKNVAPVWHSDSDVSFSANGGATRVIGDGIVTVTTSTTQATSGVYMSKNVAVNQNNYPDLFQEGNVCSFTIVADIESNFRFGSGSTHPTVSIGPTPTRLSFQTAISNTEFYIMNKTGATFTISEFQIEKNTTVATSYEPYVGGIASPNPAYPQTVNVVTGTQTITLSDGDSTTQNYIVDLGTLELAKIGTYQDYIYKSGDDWYLHKDINREDLDGSSDEQWVRQMSGGDLTTAWFQHTFEYPSVNTNERLYILSNNFTNVGTINYQNTTEGMGTLQGNVRFRWQMSTIQNLTNWRAWLGAHPTTVYYMMGTSIETQITDATLISQLDDIHQFLTRYGYNSTVSGNLPLIISKTNYL